MPKGVYIRKQGIKLKPLSEEHKQKISLALKGRKILPHQGFQKGHPNIYGFQKGCKHTQSHINKLKENHKGMLGKHQTEEMKKKISAKMKGKKLSEEHRKKLSEARKGKKLSEETKIKLSIIGKNKKLTPEQRKKMSETHKQRVLDGKCHLYKGGISKKNKRIRKGFKFKLWRETVFKRDNWTCQNCNIKGGYLHPHHIKPFAFYPKLRFKLSNGITLCENCHKKTDNFGSKAYYKPEEYPPFK